jgi:hypothetical protein
MPVRVGDNKSRHSAVRRLCKMQRSILRGAPHFVAIGGRQMAQDLKA